LIVPGSSLAVLPLKAVADDCEKLLVAAYGKHAVQQRYDFKDYSLLLLGMVELPPDGLPLYWNGHTLLQIGNPPKWLLPELSAAGYPYFSPATNPHRGFYPDQWTHGDGEITSIKYQLKKTDTMLIVKTHGWSPMQNDLERLQLNVSVNDGLVLQFSHQEETSYYFHLDNQLKTLQSIRIQSSVFTRPTADNRVLGVDLAYVEVK
jgi:hypothetical protein